MRRGDGHFRRGASSRRCNVVDDRMKRALDVAAVVAEAEVDDRMKIPLGEVAEEVVAHVRHSLRLTFVS